MEVKRPDGTVSPREWATIVRMGEGATRVALREGRLTASTDENRRRWISEAEISKRFALELTSTVKQAKRWRRFDATRLRLGSLSAPTKNWSATPSYFSRQRMTSRHRKPIRGSSTMTTGIDTGWMVSRSSASRCAAAAHRACPGAPAHNRSAAAGHCRVLRLCRHPSFLQGIQAHHTALPGGLPDGLKRRVATMASRGTRQLVVPASRSARRGRQPPVKLAVPCQPRRTSRRF